MEINASDFGAHVLEARATRTPSGCTVGDSDGLAYGRNGGLAGQARGSVFPPRPPRDIESARCEGGHPANDSFSAHLARAGRPWQRPIACRYTWVLASFTERLSLSIGSSNSWTFGYRDAICVPRIRVGLRFACEELELARFGGTSRVYK